MTSKASRREFLKTTSALSIAGSATPWAVNLASIAAASAQSAAPTDYKALVCVFMYGGNDHSNTIVPFDAAGYQQYSQSRTNLALAQNTLLSIATPTNASMAGRQVAMRAEMNSALAGQTGIKGLYDLGRVAVLANVGSLQVPTTLAQYRARSVPLPPSLFSHNDQQTNWQTSPTSREGTKIGWGGRIGDLFAAFNQYNNFTCMSASGTAVILSGTSTVQMQLSGNGAVTIAALNNQTLYGGQNTGTTLRGLMTADRGHTLEKDYNAINNRTATSAEALNTALNSANLVTVFPNSGLGNQLRNVARVIAARATLGSRRQVFHVSIGGFDQHSGLVAGHGPLWNTISQAVGSFNAAMTEVGLQDKVTLFTASDFGRTLNSNGQGSDHSWGSHHLIVGGAVKGGDMYGAMPVVVLGGPEDVGRGSLLPSTAVVQYAATLASWFGVSATNLPIVIPGLSGFSTTDLGFMNAT